MSPATAVEDLFLAALAHPDPQARAAFLAAACGDDAALRQRVEQLLDAHDRAGSFLNQPATSDVERNGEGPDTHIGPYRLLQRLGEGGMGVVWVAEQTTPVKRRVALKVIKPGMDSAQVIRRFEAERQALALMDHPNIAKVLDAGYVGQAFQPDSSSQSQAGKPDLPQGRPYFVMELVKGVPITKYCDELHLPIRERLALFIDVCRAIQHAHTKGVLHRDVKPSNVLVAIQDGRPTVKVIDFGVAKALHQPLTERTLMTEFGAVVGTLEYMSPEQAELSALDVDTRADVYGLGVLLYELLTGSTPLPRQRLKQAALNEALRLIREEEPQRPSTRITESKESLASLAAARRTEPRKLGAEVSGELDWIVMRCLEKDRSRRYETANGLARDVERHLSGEAVEACPPSVGYRLKKLARRYRRALLTAAAFAALLLLATAVSTWMAVRARQAARIAVEERNRALVAEQEAMRQKQAAVTEADNARVFADFIRTLVLEQANVKEDSASRNRRLKQILDNTLQEVPRRFGEQPSQEAVVRHTLGVAYRRLNELGSAREQLERALALRRRALGARHSNTLVTQGELLAVCRQQRDWPRVEALLRYELTEQERQHGHDHVNTCPARDELGAFYRDRGDWERAAPLFEKSLAIRIREARKGNRAAAGVESARTFTPPGRYVDAEGLFRRAAALGREQVGQADWATFFPRFYGVFSKTYAGKQTEALDRANQLAERARREGKHPDRVLLAEQLLGWCQVRAGRYAEAERLLARVIQEERKRRPVDPDGLAGALQIRADVLMRLKRFDEAEPLLRECLKLREKLAESGWSPFWVRGQVGIVLLHRKQYENAEPMLREGYEGMKAREETIAPARRSVLREALEHLIAVYDALGNKDEAARRREQLKALPASAVR